MIRVFRGQVIYFTPPVLALMFATLACGVFDSVALGNDYRGTNDGVEFGRAALELRRLPPTNDIAFAVSSFPQQRDEAVTAQTVSYDTFETLHDVDHGDLYGTQLYLGYDRGFVIGADQGGAGDAEAVDFLMRVNSWFHLRHSLFESDGPNADQNTFSFERLRLSFAGHVMSPDLKYFFQLDGNSDRETQTIFLDYFATYDLGHNLLGVDNDKLGIKVGKWKQPFSRSRKESGRLLQFSDRATANVLFDLNRSLGVGLTSKLAWIELETAIFNGFRTGSVSTSRSNATDGLDRNFGWSLRAHTELFGDVGGGEADLSWHCDPALRIGGATAYSRIDAEGPTEFSRQRVVDSGATLSSTLPPTVTAYDVWLYTVDAQFKYQGFSLIADYYWRYMTQFKGAAVPSLVDHGFVLQSGYFVVAEKLEFIGRWSRIFGDSGTLGLINESSDEVGAGFVWYMRGQNAKLTFDATHINGVPVSSARLDMLPGDAGWLFRTQFQLAF